MNLILNKEILGECWGWRGGERREGADVIDFFDLNFNMNFNLISKATIISSSC